MFTGIIEGIGEIVGLAPEAGNLHITIKSDLASQLKIDQSVSHNGVCLTVIETGENNYTVTAIKETLEKSNLGLLKKGELINLERAMKLGDRLDGHLVQGHVDQTGHCTKIEEVNGSWYFTFKYLIADGNITVEKGSVTVNGVSLTVVNSKEDGFSVAIIPYTYNYTNFNKLCIGDLVNIEFDIVGKYVKRLIPGYA
jgi:riboflavin synthase